MIKSYIITRLKQPTTWLGIFTAALAYLSPLLGVDGLQLAAAIISGAGLVHVNEGGKQ